MENIYPMIIASTLLCAFSSLKELRRTNRARLLLRILAVVLLSVSLLFFVVPITFQSTKKKNAKKLVLLTEGFKSQASKNENYFTLDSAVLTQFGANRVRFLPDLEYYLQSHPEVSVVRVYGYGLNTEDLNNLGELGYEFVASAPPAGVKSVSWPKSLPASAELSVKGTYENCGPAMVKLVLLGAGSRLDSVLISKDQQFGFNLHSWPRHSGKAIYNLVVEQGSKQISSEKIAFNIVEAPKVKILVLASSPDFELKFFRNWLFENRYPAYFRTQVSKDRYSTEVLNTDGKQSTKFNSDLFKAYDLVIADDEELAALSQPFRTSLNNAVSNGLGLLIRVNQSKLISPIGTGFQVNSAKDSLTTSIVPVITTEFIKLNPISIDRPLYIHPEEQKFGLIKDLKGNILLSSKLQGKGIISASTVGSTYSWQLIGAKADYARYWSYVINMTSRKFENRLRWQTDPQLPMLGKPVFITFQAKSEKLLPRVFINNQLRSIQQHPVLPFYYRVSSLTDHSGWNQFKVENEPSEGFFIYGPKDWNTVRINDRIVNNQDFARQRTKSGTQIDRVERVTLTISKWFFYLGFMLAIAFLWIEAKYTLNAY